MNTKVSDARQILFDLRKKYSSTNLKKYENALTSSNESLTDLSKSESVSKRRNKKENYIVKQLSARSSHKSDSSERIADKRYFDTNENVGAKIIQNSSSGNESINTDKANSLSKASSVDDEIAVSKSDLKLIPDHDNIDGSKRIERIPSDSSVSSIKSFKQEDQSEIEEVLSDEDIETSSINDPFANIHLVSDDILDEIDSSIGSRSSIKEDIHTGRLSAVQSVKSLQLSSPLEPPKLDYDYQSDFESSDDEDTSLKSVSNPEVNKNESNHVFVGSTVERIHLTKEFLHDDNNSTNNEKQGLNSSIKNHLNGSDSSKFQVVKRNESKLIKTDSSSSKVIHQSEALNLNKTVVSSVRNETFESVSEAYENSEMVDSLLSCDSKSEESEDKLSQIVTHSESLNELSSKMNSVNRKSSSPKICKQQSTSVKVKKDKYHVKNKSVGVQTSDQINLSNKFEEVKPSLKTALREKWYINTNVKSSKHRPTVKSSKLFSSCGNSTEFSPFMFTPQDGLPLNKLLDEMLRNQIAMTKHFIECHHRLYIHCCETVTSLNKNYKKNHTALFL